MVEPVYEMCPINEHLQMLHDSVRLLLRCLIGLHSQHVTIAVSCGCRHGLHPSDTQVRVDY